MGARSPNNQRPRRVGLKCEFCSRSYPSALSLRSHQNSVHASALKEKERRALSKKAAGKIQKGVKANVVVKPKPKLVKSKPKVLQPKTPEKAVSKETATKQMETYVPTPKVKEEMKEPIEKKVEMDLKASTKVKKVEFKCPICIKIFPVYFSAMRHIQKHHSKILSSKPIVPIRTELCIFCNTMVSADVVDHKCDSLHDLTGFLLTYVCMGCNEKFQSMRLFNMHISGVHSEGLESMFFPTVDEFFDWKKYMEGQTKSSYLMMGKYQYKQIYRCSKTMIDGEDLANQQNFCPSTLIFQEFSKGIQVHFYKEHCGHPSPKYVLGDQYKKYSLTDMLQQAIGYSEITDVGSEENDLYCQFKKLMESIVLDAAKINIDKLKTLTGKALEMISVLKNYNDNDDNDESLTLSLSSSRDQELTKALEALNNVTKATKRAVNTSIEVVPAKRLHKTETPDSSPILQKALKTKPTVNKFSLADNRDDQKILKELGGANLNKTSSPIPMPVKKTVESPSFNDSYKNFVEKNLKVPSLKTPVSSGARNSGPASAKKKVTVKTKMGQFKPGSSPKKAVENGTGTPVRASRSSAGKPSDIKYEVKEQENDCNILILKL